MPRSASTAIENNFVNGWITEATGLNFPENAVTDSLNYRFDKTGKTERRLGIDLENGFQTRSVSNDPDAIYTEFLWEAVAGDGNLTFALQQHGEFISIYRVGLSSSISSGYIAQINLSGYSQTSLSVFRQHPFQFAFGLGELYVTHPYMEPVRIFYDKNTNTFGTDDITIETRDTVGIPGPPNGRSATFPTASQLYNLYNQGWDAIKISRMQVLGGIYPSDFDVWWLYKTPDLLGTEVFLTAEAVYSGILSQVDRGNSPAPRGSIIFSEFYQDRSLYIADNGGILPVVSSGIHRPSSVAFFAGRVFYAGVGAPGYSSKIYFSQILEDSTQVGLCYQQNDPTSQYSSDLLPSDGGVISVPEIGSVIKLWVVEGSLLVLCSNGIWQITGSQGIGFAANDYTVKKLSNMEVLSSLSFVNVLGNPVWWSTDGIYTIASDSVGALTVQSLSESKIKSYYRTLSPTTKKYAKGAFNIGEKIIQWVYNPTATGSIANIQNYTTFLNFDLDTKAFYRYTVPNTDTTVKGIVDVRGSGSAVFSVNVVDNLGNIVTASGGNVTTDQTTPTSLNSTLKYTTVYGPSRNTLSYAEMYRGDWLDWSTVSSGTDAEAYFISGFRLRGEAQRKFQNNYLVLVSDMSAESAFLIRGQWDYARSDNFNRSSVPQLIESIDPRNTYNFRRIKIRGHGKVLQYRVDSVPGKATKLVGWSAWDTTNGSL